MFHSFDMDFFSTLSIVIIAINFISGAEREISFFEDKQCNGKRSEYTLEDECVNLDSEWVNRASSFCSSSPCVSLFTRFGCRGNSKDIYTLLGDNKFLAKVNFDEKTASFRKCGSNVEIQSGMSPIFHMDSYDEESTIQVKSGECVRFPKKSTDRYVFKENAHCFMMYNNTNCSKHAREYFNMDYDESTTRWDVVRSLAIKSFRTCELNFISPCNTSCPKLFYNGSVEYNFWTSFLSFLSPAYVSEFEQRVKRSNGDFISWDFLFRENISTKSLGDQYQDALGYQRNILRSLKVSDPGSLDLNEKSLEDLLLLSMKLSTIRFDQSYKIKNRTLEYHNFMILSSLRIQWRETEVLLDAIIQKWYPRFDKNDKSPRVSFIAPKNESAIEYTYGSRCVNLRPYWRLKTTSMQLENGCVTVYTMADCRGDSENFHLYSANHNFLGRVNFDKNISSFKKCATKTNITLNVRPLFWARVFDKNEGNQVFGVRSGDCKTLPDEWEGRVYNVEVKKYLTESYFDKNCKFSKWHRKYYSNSTEYLPMKSFKVFNLTFEGQCNSSCPKFLYNGSREYNFWMYLFSITSRHHQRQFQERVKHSKNDFISWDFFVPRNATSRPLSSNHLYTEAVVFLWDIMQALMVARPGAMRFNRTSLLKLNELASRVHEERSEQRKKFFPEKEESHDFDVILFSEKIWFATEFITNKIIETWYPKNPNEELPEITMYVSDSLAGSGPPQKQTYKYGDKCVNLPSNWTNKQQFGEVHGPCISMYKLRNCKGVFKTIYRGYSFEDEVASFKKCELIFPQDKPAARSSYIAQHFTGDRGKMYSLLSGECVPVNQSTFENWYNIHRQNFDEFAYITSCYTLFMGPACTGKSVHHWLYTEYCSKEIIQIEDAQSVRACGLTFQAPCKSSCPKYLYKNSAEYNYWILFFSIFHPARRREFEERVKQSKNGLISWNFFVASNATLPYQYQGVQRVQIIFFETSLHEIPNPMIPNGDNWERLFRLASKVHQERTKQLAEESYCDPNWLIMKYQKYVWEITEQTLLLLSQKYIRYIEKQTDETLQDTHSSISFRDDRNGKSVEHILEERCVNLQPQWTNKVNWLETHGQCVTLYVKPDCTGEAEDVYPRSRGYRHLGEVNLHNRVSSFQKCAPKLQIRTDKRPNFYFTLYDFENYTGVYKEFTYENDYDFGGYGNNYDVFNVKSDECKPLPEKWYKRITFFAPTTQCYILYEGKNCNGKKLYLRPTSNKSRHFINGTTTSSVQLCDLTFRRPCSSICPRFLYIGSPEYLFWTHFFTIISLSQRKQFEERVKRSVKGFISWDFLPSLTSTEKSLGSQYIDALECQLSILSLLRVKRPGRFGYNKENLDTLFILSKNVHNERTRELAMFDENWDDHNYNVLFFMNEFWSSVVTGLNETIQHWRNTNTDDFCGLPRVPKYDHSYPLVEAVYKRHLRPYVYNGESATYGEDPWHVALYKIWPKNKDPVLLCGGSLISTSVVLSAAHCFYDRNKKKLETNESMYEIYAGKYMREYTVTNDAADEAEKFKKKYEIQNLIYYPNQYNPELNDHFGADIVLIVLKKPVTINEYIRPVCLDWDNSIFGSRNSENLTTGRVVGWGVTSDKNWKSGSEVLMTTRLQYLSYKECTGRTKYLNIDHFCAGDDIGSSVTRGDSGGGLVFKFENRYYIRGLVSTKSPRPSSTNTEFTPVDSSISKFTDIAFYISWIREYV